jgi:hypothetical protein
MAKEAGAMNEPINGDLPAVPSGVFGALDELLRRPSVTIARSEGAGAQPILRLVVAAVACFVAYGAAAGCFQGGGQILLAAIKAPVIVLGSLLLCLPSLYVLSSLAGIEVSPRWFAIAVAGFAGMVGLLLAAAMPIAWLFSVSSSSLGFVIFVHVVVWTATLGFALRFLIQAARSRGAFSLLLWSMLLLAVSFQVASQMRPVLWRPAGMAVIEPEKGFFLEHLGRIASGKEGPPAPAAGEEGNPASKPAP